MKQFNIGIQPSNMNLIIRNKKIEPIENVEQNIPEAVKAKYIYFNKPTPKAKKDESYNE